MNPELRRNLWLEFSLHRLLALPLLIAVVVIAVLAMGNANPGETIAGMAAWAYAGLVLFWGTQRAGMSVIAEWQERTWDIQRMSAIGPWAMTWGKLLGAPAYTWYGGLMLLVLFVVSGWNSLNLPVGTLAMAMLAGALMMHALALNSSIFAAGKGLAPRGSGFALAALGFLVFGMPLIELARQSTEVVSWWSVKISSAKFLLVALFSYGAWAVLGAYRSMCGQLGLRTLPWALPTFIAFSAVFTAGVAMTLEMAGSEIRLVFLMACAHAFAMAYVMMLGEASGAPTLWHRLVARSRAGQWRRVLQELPLWLVALCCGLAFTLLSMLLPVHENSLLGPFQSFGFLPMLALYVLRDAAIVQFFALGRAPRRAEAAALFYLMLLYLLLPGLLSVMGLDAIADFLRPSLLANSLLNVAVLALQAALALGLAIWRWRRVHGQDAAAR